MNPNPYALIEANCTEKDANCTEGEESESKSCILDFDTYEKMEMLYKRSGFLIVIIGDMNNEIKEDTSKKEIKSEESI